MSRLSAVEPFVCGGADTRGVGTWRHRAETKGKCPGARPPNPHLRPLPDHSALSYSWQQYLGHLNTCS